MGKNRQSVTIDQAHSTGLIKELFRQKIPDDIIVRNNPRTINHYHSYGGVSFFFESLSRGRLFGTKCFNCKDAKIWLPPRVHCPDCWSRIYLWFEIDTTKAKVYTYSLTNYPGAGFKASVPCPLISVEIPGVCTKLMSYLSEFGEGEPYIGMPIRPVFNTGNPSYTILDLSWISRDIE